DVGAHGEAGLAGIAQVAHRLRRGQGTEMRPYTGFADQHEITRQADEFGRGGNAGQADPRTGRAFVHDAVRGQPWILGVEEHRQAERRGVGESVLEDVRIAHRAPRVRDPDTADRLQGVQLGEDRAVEVLGQRADAAHARATYATGALIDELDHGWRVDHRRRIRCAAHRGEAAARGRGELARDRRLVLRTRFAQSRTEFGEAGAHDAPARVDVARGLEPRRPPS